MNNETTKMDGATIRKNTEECCQKIIENLLSQKWEEKELTITLPFIPVLISKTKISWVQLVDKNIYSEVFDFNYLKELFNTRLKSYFKFEKTQKWCIKLSMTYNNKLKYNKNIVGKSR